MEITNISTRLVKLELQEPYTIAYETVTSAPNIFVRAETDAGITGYGCAAPDRHVTGETPADVMNAFEDAIRPQLVGADPLGWTRLLEALRSDARVGLSARAAVDMALLDILGKHARLPLWQLLGGFRDRIRTSVTVGILSEEETLSAARHWLAQGFVALKIKGGHDVERDIARVLRLRRELGDNVELRFDANQGYTVDEALHFVAGVADARIELLEQPTPRSQPEALGRVTNAVPIPVMADESLTTLRDAFRLAQREWIDMVNIKLQKVGGIYEALHINSVARAAGIDAMVSCLDEAGLAIAAGLHFALARPNVIYADLDGHLDLENDPSRNAVIIRDGWLYPSTRPGLGFDPPVW